MARSLVLKASNIIPRITTGGLDTVTIRMPSHKVALSLIEEVPIAAPSANLAGRPSPTLVEHVIEDLAGRIDLIIDSGPTNIGIESTVLDVSKDVPIILRPGGITLEDLKEVIEEVRLHPVITSKFEVERPLSPGMKYRHYAPKAEMLVVEGEESLVKKKIQEITNKYVAMGKSVGILTFDENKNLYENVIIKSLGSKQDLRSAAKRLF
ncbi:MAG: L-threonylcarbamoyladenylate synthase [Nitrososphaerales archaeon]